MTMKSSKLYNLIVLVQLIHSITVAFFNIVPPRPPEGSFLRTCFSRLPRAMATEQMATTPSIFMGFHLFWYAVPFFLDGNSNMTKLPIDTHTNSTPTAVRT